MTFRPAGPEDIGGIVHLENECFTLPKEKFNVRKVRSLLRSTRATTLVAELDGHIVAWAAALMPCLPRRTWGRIYAIAVSSHVRGKKLGQRLMQEMIARIESAKARQILLEVRTDNAAAIRLYEKLGFQASDVLKDYYGPNVDGVRMVRPV